MDGYSTPTEAIDRRHRDMSREDYHQPCTDDAEPEYRMMYGRAYLLCLTIPAGGLQMIWVAVMGQGSPLLSDLGLPAYLISLIWLAGPLSGVFVQPYISILSDRSLNVWGRRKPYIIIGTACTIIPASLLPWTADIVDILTSGHDPDGASILIGRASFAGLMIWILNIAIQPVQASAYVSRIVAVSSILGYGSGFFDLPQIFPWLGKTQFQCSFTAAALALMLTVVISCMVVRDQAVSYCEYFHCKQDNGIVSVARELFKTIREMPRSMRAICKVQFCSWLGWFPFLFYITTYLSRIHENEMPTMTTGHSYTVEMYSAHSEAIRLSTLTMVLFASVSLISTTVLPMIIKTSSLYSQTGPDEFLPSSTSGIEIQSLPDTSDFASYSTRKSIFNIPSLSIPGAWAAFNVLASVVLFATAFADSSLVVMIQVSMLGISWAMSQWAPLAIISTGISSHKPNRRSCSCVDICRSQQNGSIDKIELDYCSTRLEMGFSEMPANVSEDLPAGVAMSIYNISIAAPQIVSAVVSSCVFWVLGKTGMDSNIAIGWVIGMGGLANLAAAWIAYRQLDEQATGDTRP